jgi:hypothetical protein
MFRTRLYYRLKPLLPPAVRMAVRRWFAVRIREWSLDKWPILAGSEKPTEGWPGWPEGKQFAFVLTHDVEGLAGLEKVRPLAELEMKLGFRSSFNFIPEGPYALPLPLRSWLLDRGFEVGVQDLHHDGKLYRSRAAFARNAVRINQYLKDWGAVGFRSGFMLHNLEWLHDLNVLYDSSTFDTDPFEPQPDGVHTIFPFWVPNPRSAKCEVRSANSECGNQQAESETRNPKLETPAPSTFDVQCSMFDVPSAADSAPPPSSHITRHASLDNRHSTPRSGYVELPYTLPQDSTLFLLFRERHPDIWFQKLDWIAKHGGMALLNVHPDYLRFEGEPASSHTYPVDHYARFLRYALERHGTAFWNPLPRDLARYVHAPARLPRLHRPKRVCMLTHSFYDSDGRVIRYAEALAKRGDNVDVFSLRRSPDAEQRECVAGVDVHRIQARFGKQEKSQFAFLMRVARFLVVSSFWITRQHARKRYDLFHIHNVPDFLVFAACLAKRTGAKVILDIHDIVPEFYASKFGAEEGKDWIMPALK